MVRPTGCGSVAIGTSDLSGADGDATTMSAFQRTAINLGAALGGAAGGFVADVNRLGSFQLLFVINVATYLIFLSCLPAKPTGKVERTKAQRNADGGFRQVLRDRFYMKLLASDLEVAFAFGFLFGVMPPFAEKIGLSESEIGLLVGLGALSVVSMQIPILRLVRGRRRMRCLSLNTAQADFSRAELEAQTGCVVAMREIDLDVAPGGVFVVMGLSGSGKSTLISLSHPPHRAHVGTVPIGGIDVTDASESILLEIRHNKVSMV